MIKYVQNILHAFLEKIGHSATLPAADHLFQVRDEDNPTKEFMPEQQARDYHHSTA